MSTPLSDVLARLDALEKRFAELEEKAQLTAMPEGSECPVCGAALTLIAQHDDVHLGSAVRVLELCCVPCGFETERRFQQGDYARGNRVEADYCLPTLAKPADAKRHLWSGR